MEHLSRKSSNNINREFSVSFVISRTNMDGDRELNEHNLGHYSKNEMFKTGIFNSTDCNINEVNIEESENCTDRID